MLDTLSSEDLSFTSFFRMPFWQSGAYFSGSPFLANLEYIRASAWQSEGLVVIQVVCEAPEGDLVLVCWAFE